MTNVDNYFPLGDEALLGILIAKAECRRIPARPWPVAAACETAARLLPGTSPLQANALEAAKWNDARFEVWFRSLALRGFAHTEGRGVSARWVLNDDWVTGWQLVADAIPPEEVAAWDGASHCLARCLSMWDNTVAAALSGSRPSDSGH